MDTDTKKPTPAEIAQLDAIAAEIQTLRTKWHAISDKYTRCGDCGAWYGDKHNKDCDQAMCMGCGNQINDPGAHGCKCDEPIVSEFMEEKF